VTILFYRSLGSGLNTEKGNFLKTSSTKFIIMVLYRFVRYPLMALFSWKCRKPSEEFYTHTFISSDETSTNNEYDASCILTLGFPFTKVDASLSFCTGNERDRHQTSSSEDSLLACHYRSLDLREVLVAKRFVSQLAVSSHGNGNVIYVPLILMCFLSPRCAYRVSYEAKLSTKRMKLFARVRRRDLPPM